QRRDLASMRGLVRHVGKESNDLENRIHQLVTDEANYLNVYEDPEDDPFNLIVRPVLKDCLRERSLRSIANEAGMAVSTAQEILNGVTRDPRPNHRQRLTEVAGAFARDRLRDDAAATVRDDLLACASYLRQAVAG